MGAKPDSEQPQSQVEWIAYWVDLHRDWTALNEPILLSVFCKVPTDGEVSRHVPDKPG